MAQTTGPFSLVDVSLTLDLITAGVPAGAEQEFMCQLNRAELVPASAASGSEFETFCDTFAAPSKQASWTLEITGFQAFKDATDLSLFLFDHELSEAAFLLTPNGPPSGISSTTYPGFSGIVTLTPGAIGGTANQYAQMTVSLAVKGKPTKVSTAPTLLEATV